MKNEAIMVFLRAQKDEIARRFAMRRIGLFGCHVRGTAMEHSDVDISLQHNRTYRRQAQP